MTAEDHGEPVAVAGAAAAPPPVARAPLARFAELPTDRSAAEHSALGSLALDAAPSGWIIVDRVVTNDQRGNGFVSYIQLGEVTDVAEGGSIVVSATVFDDREQARATWKDEQRLLKGSMSTADGEERFDGSSDEHWRATTWVRGRVLVSVTSRNASPSVVQAVARAVKGAGQ